MKNTFSFGMVSLFVATVVFAIAAWLISAGQWYFAILWLCSIAGYETGRRTEYPAVLMGFCGMTMGVLVVIAIGGIFAINLGYSHGAIAIMEKGKSLASSSGRVLLALDLTLWLAAFAILFWFFWLLKKTCQNPGQAVK